MSSAGAVGSSNDGGETHWRSLRPYKVVSGVELACAWSAWREESSPGIWQQGPGISRRRASWRSELCESGASDVSGSRQHKAWISEAAVDAIVIAVWVYAQLADIAQTRARAGVDTGKALASWPVPTLLMASQQPCAGWAKRHHPRSTLDPAALLELAGSGRPARLDRCDSMPWSPWTIMYCLNTASATMASSYVCLVTALVSLWKGVAGLPSNLGGVVEG